MDSALAQAIRAFQKLGNVMKQFYQQPELVSPIPQGQAQAYNNQPAATPTPSQEDVLYQQMLEGFGRYGATPSAQAVRVMAQAPERYPNTFGKNPYLLPAMSIVETGAGKNITRPKNTESPQNLMNWGITTDFEPKNQAESVEKAMTGIGERMPYYEAFRQSGNVEDFAHVYAPPSDGNDGYMEKLRQAQSYFK